MVPTGSLCLEPATVVELFIIDDIVASRSCIDIGDVPIQEGMNPQTGVEDQFNLYPNDAGGEQTSGHRLSRN